MKNHPHDNIYSILGKLDALKPTPEEKRFALVKEIRESVEAKGSILSGVDAVQDKLAKQFAEGYFSDLDVQKKDKQLKGTQAYHAKKKSEKEQRSADSKKSFDDMLGGSPTELTSKLKIREVEQESADKKDLPFDVDSTEKKANKVTPGKHGQEYSQVRHLARKDLSPNVKKSSKQDEVAEDMSRAAKGYEKYGKAGMTALAKAGRNGASEKELDSIRDKHDQYNESKNCLECGMAEGTCSHTMAEDVTDMNDLRDKMEWLMTTYQMRRGEAEETAYYDNDPETWKGSQWENEYTMAEGEITKTEKGMRHRGTYGTEYQGDHDSEDDEQYKADKGIRKRGRPAKGTPKKVVPATGEKKGRGRPAKAAAPTYSAANDPFGRVPSKAPASKIKGTKHSLAESMQRVIEGVNFKRMAEDHNMTLDEMMDCMDRDITEYKMTGQMTETLRDFMEIHTHSKKQMADEAVNAEVPAFIRKQKGGDWMAKPSDILDPKPDTLSHPANMQKRADALGFNDANPFAMPKKGVEEELDELAKLAGLNMESVDKAKFAALAEPKDKITYADKIAGAKKSEVDEEATDEGNAFGKAVRDAKADGVEPGEKVTVGGKEYAVKEARELVQMLKIAGLDTKQLEEAIDAAVNEFAPVVGAIGRAVGGALGGAARAIGGAMGDVGDEVAEGRMGEIDALYQEWVNSEDAPFDDDSGDFNAVAQKAMRFLNGRVRPEEIEDIADLLVNHWHGGRGVMGEEEELANAPDEKYMSIKATTLNPGEGDGGEKNMYGGPGDNPMTQRPSRPALPIRSESVIKLEAKLAAEYNSIKKTTR
jgi:hypothetical protein